MVECEVFLYPSPSLPELLLKAHDVESVEAVNNSSPEGGTSEYTPRVSLLRLRAKLIFTPRIADVVIPSVFRHLKQLKECSNGGCVHLQ